MEQKIPLSQKYLQKTYGHGFKIMKKMGYQYPQKLGKKGILKDYPALLNPIQASMDYPKFGKARLGLLKDLQKWEQLGPVTGVYRRNHY